MKYFTLEDFIIESNRIEGIVRNPRVLKKEVYAAEVFLQLRSLLVCDLQNYVNVIQPSAVLRNQFGRNVAVSNYTPPPGGSEIAIQLTHLLNDASYLVKHYPFPVGSIYHTHIRYEKLHPFTDGNGRSGRMVWLWMMRGIKRVPLGFLHTFYYQTLDQSGDS